MLICCETESTEDFACDCVKNSPCTLHAHNVQVENTAQANLPEWSLKIALTCCLHVWKLGDIYIVVDWCWLPSQPLSHSPFLIRMGEKIR